MHLDYTGIRVQDLLKSLRFYARGLGLLEIRRGNRPQGGTWILLEDPVSRQRLELNWYPPGSRNDTPWRAGEELHHLAVRTSDTGAVAQRLRAAGAKNLERKRVASLDPETVLLEDPNGIVIELLPEPQELMPMAVAEA